MTKQSKSTKTIKHEFESGKRAKREKLNIESDLKDQGRKENKNASKSSHLAENEHLRIG